MRLRGSRKFFEINIFSFPRFKRLASRERSSALMAHGRLICLAALSGQPPEPGGSRRKARGVDGGSARRATIRPGHYDTYMRLRGSRKFFEINIFSFPRFK